MMRRRWLQLAAAWPAALGARRAAATAGPADNPGVPPSPHLRHRVSATRDLRSWRHAGLDLSYLDTGGSDLPVLVCLHAIGHGSGDFEAMAEAMRGRYRIIAPDWPGQGRSRPAPSAPGVRAYAEILQAFVDTLQLPRLALVGNSVGGGAALLYAARHPQRVRALVVANPAGLDEGGFLGRMVTRWMSRRFAAADRDPEAFQQWFARYYGQVLTGEAAGAQRQRIVASGLEIAPLLAQAWHGFAEPENDIRSDLPGLQMPVLVTWARQDRLVRWSRNRKAIELIARRQVEFFEAGHTPFLEEPSRFVSLVEPFLASAT
jgi:4,5:9,10-diseco-3-hydroxy-5,9,17-trioxoandrosta-1(10),2-diene-4-oate hydrolase